MIQTYESSDLHVEVLNGNRKQLYFVLYFYDMDIRFIVEVTKDKKLDSKTYDTYEKAFEVYNKVKL